MIGNLTAGFLGIFTPSYSQVVLDDNPIGFWLLNETTGTTGDDLTANNNNLTFFNSPTLNVATGLDGIPVGITFDGSNDRLNTSTVSIFNIAASGNWSVEIWLKTNSSTFSNFFAWRDSTGSGNGVTTSISLNNGTIGMIMLQTVDSSGNGLNVSHTNNYNDNAWHHVVCTATSGGAARLYVDGVDRANTTTARRTNTSNRAIVVGANDFGGGTYSQFYTGTATAVSVYNTALSAAQVLAHYNAGK
jgi:hypothetical protein